MFNLLNRLRNNLSKSVTVRPDRAGSSRFSIIWQKRFFFIIQKKNSIVFEILFCVKVSYDCGMKLSPMSHSASLYLRRSRIRATFQLYFMYLCLVSVQSFFFIEQKHCDELFTSSTFGSYFFVFFKYKICLCSYECDPPIALHIVSYDEPCFRQTVIVQQSGNACC